MKNALILPGTSSKPADFWFPYLKKQLELRQYEVFVPELPQAEKPDLNVWLPWILTHCNFNSETVLVGHSAGAAVIPAILEKLKVKIHQAIMVGGFIELINEPDDPILKPLDQYDWKKIRANVGHMTVINSTNDPWGLNDQVGKQVFDKIGDRLIIHREGHMGSNTFNQPYTEFPLLVKLIELEQDLSKN